MAKVLKRLKSNIKDIDYKQTIRGFSSNASESDEAGLEFFEQQYYFCGMQSERQPYMQRLSVWKNMSTQAVTDFGYRDTHRMFLKRGIPHLSPQSYLPQQTFESKISEMIINTIMYLGNPQQMNTSPMVQLTGQLTIHMTQPTTHLLQNLPHLQAYHPSNQPATTHALQQQSFSQARSHLESHSPTSGGQQEFAQQLRWSIKNLEEKMEKMQLLLSQNAQKANKDALRNCQEFITEITNRLDGYDEDFLQRTHYLSEIQEKWLQKSFQMEQAEAARQDKTYKFEKQIEERMEKLCKQEIVQTNLEKQMKEVMEKVMDQERVQAHLHKKMKEEISKKTSLEKRIEERMEKMMEQERAEKEKLHQLKFDQLVEEAQKHKKKTHQKVKQMDIKMKEEIKTFIDEERKTRKELQQRINRRMKQGSQGMEVLKNKIFDIQQKSRSQKIFMQRNEKREEVKIEKKREEQKEKLVNWRTPYGHLFLIEGNRITFKGNERTQIMLDAVIERGKKLVFSVQILHTKSGSIMIGVTNRRQLEKQQSSFNSGQGICYFGGGDGLFGDNPCIYYGYKCSTPVDIKLLGGMEVQVEVQSDKGVVNFIFYKGTFNWQFKRQFRAILRVVVCSTQNLCLTSKWKTKTTASDGTQKNVHEHKYQYYFITHLSIH